MRFEIFEKFLSALFHHAEAGQILEWDFQRSFILCGRAVFHIEPVLEVCDGQRKFFSRRGFQRQNQLLQQQFFLKGGLFIIVVPDEDRIA